MKLIIVYHVFTYYILRVINKYSIEKVGENKMIIENVDWQITSFCNRNCKYCFGPSHIQSLNKSEIFKIIDCLSSNGVKQLGITGGEPLLYPDIEEIINYAISIGLNIYLSTNCDYYFTYAKLIKEKISIIGIPIDGSNAETHDYLRGHGSFENIKRVLNDISNGDSKIKIKFGTVITNCNQNDLLAIEKFISSYSSKIIFWKLYEIITYDRNLGGTEELRCDSAIKKNNLGQFLDKQLIIDDTSNKRNKSYFFLKPNGDVFVPELTHKISYERIIGNILMDDFKVIASRFHNLVNDVGYYSNYRYMKNEKE